MPDWIEPPIKNIDDAFGKQTYDIIANDLEYLRQQALKAEVLMWAGLAHGGLGG